MLTDLQGKTFLITGSSRGIGRAIATLLHRAGARPLLNARSESDALLDLAHTLNTEYFIADISNDQAVQEMADVVTERYGPLDGLVNNAGGGGWASIHEPDTEWSKSFESDLMGAVRTCRYLMPAMEQAGRGAVVNITSMWGISQTAKPSIASYCCMKAALCKLTEVLAQQYAPTIRVNAVAPGWTRTDMIMGNFGETQQAFMHDNVLREALADPEDIGAAVCFLLSDMAANITGQIVPVDGGYLLKRGHSGGKVSN